MQWTQVTPFFSYFNQEFLKKKAAIALILTTDEEEKKSFLAKALEKILSISENLSFQHFASDTPIKEIFSSLSSLTFFSSRPALLLDAIDMRSREEIEQLLLFTQKIEGEFILILGAKNVQNLSEWMAYIASVKGAILDLRKEKIWDKEKRLKEEIQAKAQKMEKIFSLEALDLLLKRIGNDSLLLQREVEKLITYTSFDQNRIEVQDVLAISSFSFSYTLWQSAERVVFGQEFILEKNIDDAFFHGMIRLVRSQLEMGLKIALLLENNCSNEEILSHFPKLFPTQLDKRKPIIKERGATWFSFALKELFSIDLLSKTKESNYALLWQLFLGKIFIKKKEYARSSS